MKLTIQFPHPDRAISPNGQVPLTRQGAIRMNYKKVALKRATRNAAYLEAKNAMQYILHRGLFVPHKYDIVWRYKGRKPDVDNIVARTKPLIDGCCKAFGIDDRDLELGRVDRVHTKGREAGTVLLIFEEEL